MSFLPSALIDAALAVRQQAYAPYSHYQVGAALLSLAGEIYRGCNVENAAYPMCICAERVALVKAISEGVRQFSHIVVATRDGGTPCGMCRQMLSEFAPQLVVIMVNEQGSITLETTLDQLLPGAFTAQSLPGA